MTPRGIWLCLHLALGLAWIGVLALSAQQEWTSKPGTANETNNQNLRFDYMAAVGLRITVGEEESLALQRWQLLLNPNPESVSRPAAWNLIRFAISRIFPGPLM